MYKTIEFGVGDECVILDKHTISSKYIGENEFGFPKFETEYTELGKLVNELKYKECESAINKIIDLIKSELDIYLNKIDLVVPVPPSNKKRKYQPVFKLAEKIGEYLEKEYKLDLLYKTSSNKAKDKKSVANTIKMNYNLDKKVNILLVDDLYSSGITMKECCKVLKQDKNVNKIYCLAMTRTKK